MRGRIFHIGYLLLFATANAFGQAGELRLRAEDTAGRSVASASAMVRAATGIIRPCRKNGAAIFICTVTVGEVLSVSSEGFVASEKVVTADDVSSGTLTLRLEPSGLRETVIVSAQRSETRLGDTPASIAVIGREDIAASAAPTLDDTLRQVPGFSIFRRSSSRNANPTTQGVSLRGVGSSGASRTLVMLDGVPLNDPFGGWVQWNRVSPIAIERAEVVRGGASNLYGTGALSGTIDIASRRSREDREFSAEVFGGNLGTIGAFGFGGASYKGWTADLSGGYFRSTGFVIVDEDVRGPVDSDAGVSSVNFSGRFGMAFNDAVSVFARPSYFSEDRSNGTPLQTNQTHSRGLVIGGDFRIPTSGTEPLKFDWRVFGATQVYDQTFAAVNEDRTAETFTRLQRSPARSLGFSTQLTTAIRTHTIVAGVEGRNVRGSSDEVGYFHGVATSLLGTGGGERAFGVFVQDIFTIGERFVITAGVRYDRWNNYGGYSALRPFSATGPTVTLFADRSESSVNPKASMLARVTDRVSIYAAASRSFRAPTLNELYRGFRVGSVVTNANADLLAERATNFEAGASYANGRTYLRGNFFYTKIDQAIANVTVSATPILITRQRQNAGSTSAAGFEADAQVTIRSVTLHAGYQFANSRVVGFPSNPELVDKFVPQVPRHQFTAQARYAVKNWTASLQARAAGQQFDDDLNQFRLEPFLQLDAFVSRRVTGRLTAFLAAENILNSRYSVGRTLLRTVSSPTTLRLGLRWT